MSRVTTSNYGADPTTQFAWATTDADLFDREKDLYFLAQAVENHTHGVGRGLAVARVAANVVDTAALQALSVTDTKLAASAVTNTKIATGAVSDDKMAVQKVNRTGDAITNDLQINRSGVGAPTTGYLILGNNTANYLGFDGVNLVGSGNRLWHEGNDGVASSLDAGLLGGQLPGFYATAASVTALVTFPLSGVVWFQTSAQLAAAGAKFARFTTADGRLLLGAGNSLSGQVFAENTPYGGSWTPASGVGVTNGTLAVSSIAQTGASGFLAPTAGGTTATAPLDHTHPAPSLSGSVAIAGTGTVWHIPSHAGVWGQRTS